ncbi:hypothetical protein CR513_04075, partial [Mucuna pruriens]
MKQTSYLEIFIKWFVLNTMHRFKFFRVTMKQYLEAHGIVHQTTFSYTKEAFTFATYLINCVPSIIIDFSTPSQALTEAIIAPVIPNLSLEVYGCVAFVHLYKHQRVDSSSVDLLLIKKGYQCSHPPTQQMFVTLDVVFDIYPIEKEIRNCIIQFNQYTISFTSNLVSELQILGVLFLLPHFSELLPFDKIHNWYETSQNPLCCSQPSVIIIEDKIITLGPNELPNLMSSYRLDDRNYLQWAQYIRTTLKGHKKLSHVEGNDPPRDDPKFEAWDDEDSLIMT